jgi:multicomponent K+:H+ antiporter subunit A
VTLLAAVPVLVLCAGLLLELALSRVLSRSAKGWLAFIVAVAAFAASLLLLQPVLAGDVPRLTLFSWGPGVAFSFYVDGLSLLFTLMATGLGAAVLLYCVRYIEREEGGATRFYVLMIAFILAMVNLVCSENLLIMYFSWAMMGLCSYLLVAFWYRERDANFGSRKVLVYTHIPGFGFLLAVILLYVATGTFMWTSPAISAAFTTGIFLLILIAAMAKSAMFPLNTWLPSAMPAPTPVSSLLHAACYVKAGAYLIARTYAITPWQPSWSLLVMAIGSVAMIVGVFFALIQVDIKQLLAYHTISQLGYIIAALGLNTALGIAAGLFYLFTHALFKGTLFLCAGAVDQATGTRDMRKLGGLSRLMPHTTWIWLIATAAIIGVPLTNGFVAKWLVINASLESGAIIVAIIAWLVGIITAYSMLKATNMIFFGEIPEGVPRGSTSEAPRSMLIGMGIMGLLCLAFGIAPQIMLEWMIAPAVSALMHTMPLTVSWYGVQTAMGGVAFTAVALIVVSALAIGAVVAFGLFRAARWPRPREVNVFTGGMPLPRTGERVGPEDFVHEAEMTFHPLFVATNPDPAYGALWNALKGLSGVFARHVTLTEKRYPLVATLVMGAAVAALILTGG